MSELLESTISTEEPPKKAGFKFRSIFGWLREGELKRDLQSSFGLPEGSRPVTITVMNQKGGCGKTTTVVNLSAALAIKGGKVLVVDLDPQAHATLGLGVSVDKLQRSVYDLLVNPNVVFGDVMRPCQIPGLHILPSASRLASAQLELADIQAGEQALRSKLQNVQQHYDFILLDCPPTLNLLTLNALCYASKVLIPVQTHYYALEGMKELFRTIESVKQQFNPGLETLGILATLYDKRIKIAEEVLHALRDYFGSQMFKTVIHNNVKLIESPMVQQSVITYAPTSLGAIEYQQLAEEVLALVTKSN